MKKFLNSLLLFFLFLGASFSQGYPEYIMESTQNADIIVEGYIGQTEAYKAENGTTFTKNHLFVSQTLKGEGLHDGRIVVETPGGKIGDIEIVCSHCAKLGMGEKGIFFLKLVDGRYVLLNGNAGKINRADIDWDRQGVIPSLRKYVPDWDALVIGIKRAGRGEVITEEELMPTDTEICFKVDSIKVIDERHVSAKVYAKSNISNMKFGGAELSVQYPTDMIGSDIVQNNLLSTTAGDFVSDGTVYSISQSDVSENQFKLEITSSCTSSLTYAVLGTTYEEIAELVLEVDITQANELVEGSEITDAKGKYHDSVSGDCLEFRRICLEGEVLVAACSGMEVEIIGEPGAGIGSIARITGEDFKESPGKLKINDADTDMPEAIVFESVGGALLSWSDDLIEVDITSVTPPGIMGSGTWVVDPSGLSGSCEAEVDIKYSVQNATVTDTDENGMQTQNLKYIRRYSTNSLQGAVTYYLDNTINANQGLSDQGITFDDVEMIVKEVLCEWEEKIGVSMNYGGGIDPNIYINELDELNIIFFEDAATVHTIAMDDDVPAFTGLVKETSPACVEEVNGALTRYPIAKDSYLVISEDEDWYDKNSGQNIGSSEVDLFTVILHEVGHTLGLDHALDPENNGGNDTRIMYPFVEPNIDNRHTVNDGDMEGGMFIAQKSRELLQSPNLLSNECGNEFSLNNQKFCTLTPVSFVEGGFDGFTVYPSPATIGQGIIVTNKLGRPSWFLVSDILGRSIDSFELVSDGSINMSFEDKGIYFVSAMVEGQLFTKKIIVQ